MPVTMLSAWDTANGITKLSFLLSGILHSTVLDTHTRVCVRAHTHTNHVCLEELELVQLEEYFLTKPTSLSRWNPYSLYTNYEMEWKTKF